VVRRHPIPVSLANNQRWKVTFAPLHKLFDHWLHCYKLFEEDKRYLKHVYELTYEDYIQDSNKSYQRIAEFVGTQVRKAPKEDNFYYVTQWRNPVGLRVPETAMEDVSGAHNEKYFNRWSHLLDKSPFKRYYRYLAAKYEPKFAKYDYSLINGFVADENPIREAGHVSAITAAFYSRAAEVCAISVRTPLQARGYIKKQLRTHLPQSVKLRVKHLLGKMPFNKQPKALSS
jgi:hypothetical protein